MTPKEEYDAKVLKINAAFGVSAAPFIKERDSALVALKPTWRAAKKSINDDYTRHKKQVEKKYFDATKEKAHERDLALAQAWIEFREKERGN